MSSLLNILLFSLFRNQSERETILFGVFAVIILLFLVLDLGIFNKHAHKISTKSALYQSIFWVIISTLFGYLVFLQGDQPIVKMETLHKNGRKIAIVKESYGNAFAPFLINNYEKVIVVDQRYYTGDFIKMLKAEGINELLFINNIFAAHTPFHIDKIKALKK